MVQYTYGWFSALLFVVHCTLGFFRTNVRARPSIASLIVGLAIGSVAHGQVRSEAAIDAAKRYLGKECTAARPCEFSAKREHDQWSVYVQFVRLGPNGERFVTLGGHAYLIVDKYGKVVKRLDGE
jgi:hypothetical protein